MAADITEVVKLPSKGLIYDPSLEISEDITIRAMTTKEEKALYGSTNTFLDYIIKQCIVSPAGINVKKLLPADKLFLLFKIRIISYGPGYNITYRCPFCDKISNYKLSLDDLDTNYLDDNFVEPIEIKLPKCGDTLQIKLLRDEDLEDVSERAKKLHKKMPEAVGDFEYTLRFAKYIQTVNGETKNSIEMLKYVEGLVGRDSAYFWAQINKIKIGINDIILETCPKCQAELEIPLPINGEFFHPRYDD